MQTEIARLGEDVSASQPVEIQTALSRLFENRLGRRRRIAFNEIDLNGGQKRSNAARQKLLIQTM